MRVVSYNAFGVGYDPQDRPFRTQMEVLRGLAPDILVLQDARGWTRRKNERMLAMANALGMQPLHGNRPEELLLYLRWPSVRCTGFDPQNGIDPLHIVARADLSIDGLDLPLTLLAARMHPTDGNRRLAEALWLTRPEHTNGYTIVAGDLHCVAPDDPEPDWGEVRRHGAIRHRWCDDVPRPADRRVMCHLLDNGYVDPADHFGLPFARTVGHTCEEAARRCDYVLVSTPLAGALAEYHVVDDARTQALSDHLPVVADLDLPTALPSRVRVTRSVTGEDEFPTAVIPALRPT